MADVSDVETALVALLAAAIFPNGTSAPTVIDAPVALMRGWPIPAVLDMAMQRGQVLISVYGQNNTESNVSRFQDDWREIAAPVLTITTTVDQDAGTVTLGGTVSTPQNVAVIVGDPPGQIGEVYAVQSGDTLASIATGLAALLAAAGVPVTSSGPTLTFGTGATLTARVGGFGTVVRELKRQERTFQVTVWCATPEQRDIAAPVVDKVIARNRRLNYPDGTNGRMLYASGHVLDEKQTVDIYRRDILCRIEYPTIDTAEAPQVLVPTVTVELQSP